MIEKKSQHPKTKSAPTLGAVRSLFLISTTCPKDRWPSKEYYVAGVVIFEPSDVNWVFNGPVISGMAAIRQTPIAAAMRPYSMAVAPDSSARNFFILISRLKTVFNPKLLAECRAPLEHVTRINLSDESFLNTTRKILCNSTFIKLSRPDCRGVVDQR
jgi:hypothetical protein